MKRMYKVCDNCSGLGNIRKVNVIESDNNIGTMWIEEDICEECNGKGYTEYAVFSIEEAEAILKHCGLNTEN